ncbi:hypothetical protein BIW11_03899 [Tropilaelaps mercedesae]|uniref:Uncharacterized protein n=1 Tax=Tropilaelaps mercedesae TaxID=418985 RepID=A0A1V9XE47_9ACAR|nr:hypothetical protein BIW11_03899 [Tropilaelaps mercedesae]
MPPLFSHPSIRRRLELQNRVEQTKAWLNGINFDSAVEEE